MNNRQQIPKTIALFLCLLLLFSLLCACQRQSDPVQEAIPDGWEVVATDGDLTFLQLKEGSDAYHWMEYDRVYSHKQEYYPIDWGLPNQSDKAVLQADANGNVQIIVYYGYMYLKYHSGTNEYVMYDPPNHAGYQSKDLRMKLNDTDRVLTNMGAENTVVFQNGAQLGDPEQVGFTRAVLISLPISQWENGPFYAEFLEATPVSENGTYGYGKMISVNATVWNDRLYFSYDALEEDFNRFPLSLLDEQYGSCVIAYFLLAAALMLASAILGKSRRVHWIACGIGMAHTLCAIIYASESRSIATGISGMSFGEQGQHIWLIFMLFRFVEWGVLLWLIRKLIDRIRQRIREKKKAKEEITEKTDDLV